MKYYIGKLGQKLVFNRDSSLANRSNTNGNVGAYTFFNLLIECMKDDVFVSCFNDDLENSEYLKQHSNIKKDKIENDGIGIFMLGMVYDADFYQHIEMLNKTNLPYYIFCDDIRCLTSFSRLDIELTNLPIKIYGQSICTICIKDKVYNVEYAPLEKTILYNAKSIDVKKTLDCIILANDSNNEYDRLSVVEKIVKDKIDVYGRLKKNQVYSKNFKGEVTYDESQLLLSSSYTTLVVPVSSKVITSKYIEAIINGTFPIFHHDYLYEYADFNNKVVISTYEELMNALKNKEKMYEQVQNERTRLLEKYSSGIELVKEFKQLIGG